MDIIETINKRNEFQDPFPPVHTWYYPGITYKNFLQALKNVQPNKGFEYYNTFSYTTVISLCNTYTRNPLFQFWIKEYVDGLATLILEMYGTAKVIEVGAGNGELTFLLKERGVNIEAFDNESWSLEKRHPVTTLHYNEAIKQTSPELVIASWIPYCEDWTKDFRKHKVSYMLIGEGAGGCCADYKSFEEKRGWKRIHDFDFDAFNICRTDFFTSAPDGEYQLERRNHSETVLFEYLKRKKV